MIKLSSTLLRTTALAALLAGFGAALPAHAQTADSSDAPAASDTMAPVGTSDNNAPSGAHGDHMMGKHHGDVEMRIKTLHDKLMITKDQESAWSNVAGVMRSNEANIRGLIEERHSSPESMTAVDDLQSYQKIAQAHADGSQKMLDSFKSLYSEMSDAQKKNADTVFGSFEGHHGMHHKKAM